MCIHKVWGLILSSIFVFSSITYAATYSGGDGSQANPYQINTVAVTVPLSLGHFER